jgi:hypothetical protein
MDLSSVSERNKVGLSDLEDRTIGRTHTSAVPIHGCLRDKHFSSSTSGKYNGSGMRAVIMRRRCKWKIALKDRQLPKCKPTLQIPHAALHSSLVAETWLAWQSMPLWQWWKWIEHRLSCHSLKWGEMNGRTKIHDMIPADGAVIDDDVYKPLAN